MRAGRHVRTATTRPWLRQLVAGLVALPLSALPFVGYTTLTPEGRLVRDRALVALWPPSLPAMAPGQTDAAAAAAPRYHGPVMALAYHGIGSASDGDGGFVVSPARFGEHLATLRAAGMSAVTASQVARAFEGGTPLPPKAVMISFDDGRTDALMFADPLLEQARMKATMFVITGAAEEPGIYYASWDKLEGYARSGRWDLQAHTDALHRDQKAAGGGTLPALTSLAPGESLAEFRVRVRADLSTASAALERHAGRPPVAFAYPFGAYGAERTNHPGIRKILRDEVSRRYALAFHQDDQSTVPLARSDHDRLGLRRLEVGDWSGLELLKRIARAARPAPPAESGPLAGPPADQAQGPAHKPDGAPTPSPPTARPDGSTSPSVPAPRVTVPRETLPRVAVPQVTLPRVTVPPAPALPLGPVGAAPPPIVSPTTSPAPSVTLPPTTVPPLTTTSTSIHPPPTTTPVPPTTAPPGCRSHGQGNSCSPKGGR